MKGKISVLGVLIIIVGGIIGGLIADLTHNISFLSWLSYGGTFGIATGAPMVIDLGIMKFTFGLTVNITVAVVIGLLVSVIIWKKVN